MSVLSLWNDIKSISYTLSCEVEWHWTSSVTFLYYEMPKSIRVRVIIAKLKVWTLANLDQCCCALNCTVLWLLWNFGRKCQKYPQSIILWKTHLKHEFKCCSYNQTRTLDMEFAMQLVKVEFIPCMADKTHVLYITYTSCLNLNVDTDCINTMYITVILSSENMWQSCFPWCVLMYYII